MGSGTACGGDDDGPVPDGGARDAPMPPPGTTLREQLTMGPLTIPLVADPPGVALTSTITPASGGEMVYPYELDVSGTVDLSADVAGNLIVSNLALDLEDLVVSMEALPPDGATFSDLHVETSAPLASPGTWSASDDAVDAEATATLLFDWGLVQSDGTTVPFAQQMIEDVMFVTHATRLADGTVEVTIDGARDGEFLTWVSYVALSDVRITVRGSVP